MVQAKKGGKNASTSGLFREVDVEVDMVTSGPLRYRKVEPWVQNLEERAQDRDVLVFLWAERPADRVPIFSICPLHPAASRCLPSLPSIHPVASYSPTLTKRISHRHLRYDLGNVEGKALYDGSSLRPGSVDACDRDAWR